MKKVNFIITLVLLLQLFLGGCKEGGIKKPQTSDGFVFSQIKGLEEYKNITGVKVENSIFYFTALVNNQLNYYSYFIESNRIEKVFANILDYDRVIPLDNGKVLFLDYDGRLFIRRGNKDKFIDEGITGVRQANVLVAPTQDVILYTINKDSKGKLILFDIHKNKRTVIIEEMDDNFLDNFFIHTKFSNTGKYFALKNSRIYNREGNLIANINGSSIKWSPNDKWLAYIKASEANDTVLIGEYEILMGEALSLYSMTDNETKDILKFPEGIIDPMDIMKWNSSSSKLAIAYGNIVISNGHFERMDFQSTKVYDIEMSEWINIEGMNYNFYEFLLENYIYAFKLGERRPLLLVDLINKEKMELEAPLLLNNRDMFAIKREELAYMMNYNNLILINNQIEIRELFSFPIFVKELYYDSSSGVFIVIDDKKRVYTLHSYNQIARKSSLLERLRE